MKFICGILACLVAWVASGVGAKGIPFSGPLEDGNDLFAQLAPHLSSGAAIILPGDPLIAKHQRWQAYSQPRYSAVVEVATESDIGVVVRFANNHSLPFLAVDGAHGHISTLGKMQRGIAISFIRMKGIKISTNGKYADLQPGLTNGELIRYLWAKGKQTVTGNCLCTGIMGIMLGGGHGYLQGLFGLLADQILEARVVLADGSSVTASPSLHKDLFWGLRGAGHNFGIVTGLRYKTYDSIPEWSQISVVFTQDKLERVFDLANRFLSDETHPAELILWFTLMRRPDIDNTSAIININIIYAGPIASAERFAAPFRALGPARQANYSKIQYPELFVINRNDEASPQTCGKGLFRHMFPTYLPHYNTTALRQVHTIFTNITTQHPTVASTSIYVIEGYSHQAVLAVPSDSTAFPYRAYPLLASPVWGYNDTALSGTIQAASRDMRQAMVRGSGEGQPLRGYVNYAFGDESTRELYGHEAWRGKKLKALKKRWDPRGRFGFYAPIVPGDDEGW